MESNAVLDLIDLKSKLAGETLPWPHPGSWALSPDSCRFLSVLVRELKPRRILEFGSGYSTSLMARELGDGARIDSIDNLTAWSDKAKERAVSAGIDDKIDFHVFPLGLVLLSGQPYISFQLPENISHGPAYDLVLVDAPHQDVSREGTVVAAGRLLRKGGVLLCDDCNAPHMAATLSRWKDRVGGAFDFKLLPDIGSGLGIGFKLSDGPPVFRAAQIPAGLLRALRNARRVSSLKLNDPKGPVR